MNRTTITVEWESHTDFRNALEFVALSNELTITRKENNCSLSAKTYIDSNYSKHAFNESVKYVIELLEIGNKSRKTEIKLARHLFWWYMKNNTNLSFERIGNFTGHDHSTVLSALKKIPFQIRQYSDIRKEWLGISELCDKYLVIN